MCRLHSKWSLKTQLLATLAVAVGVAILAERISISFRISPLISVTIALALGLGVGGILIGRMVVTLTAFRARLESAARTGAVSELADADASAEWKGLGDACASLIGQLHEARQSNSNSHAALEARAKTVDQLLDFSQTIQGAGKADQIFASLGHYLRGALPLSAVAILTHEPQAVPPTQVKVNWPGDASKSEALAEMETSLCPCLRQNLPRHFRPDGAPVRCAVEGILGLPSSHPAYCVPFNIGQKVQVVVHMLVPPDESWTEERRQLAQTYVNSAHAALVSLHLLAEAEEQSMTDGLTGLFNRRSMDQLLQREVALTERHGHALSLVMIDMDFFKQINDTHGHAAGDHLLRAFADCVRITLRKTDLAFRYGGDEFVIALPQTTIDQARAVVQKLRQAFGAVDFSSAITNLQHTPTLSIGLAERSKANNVLTLPNLLSAVDQALYEAKSADRNCVRVYQPPNAA